MKKSESITFYEATGVDVTTAGEIMIGRSPEEIYSVQQRIVILARSIIGFVSSDLEISIGTNSPDFDDILQGVSLASLFSTGDFFSLDIDNGKAISGNRDIVVKRAGTIVASVAELTFSLQTKQLN